MFESLDDLGVRTAGTTYLMYRGRYEHQTSKNTALTRLASTVFRRPVMGPKELFYADIFASRETPCRSQLGLPGIRDQHAGCVGAYLVEQDLFDFLLLSLPDNDTHSHRHGPHAQVTSIAAADRQLERLFHAGGGTEQFLDEHAVIVVADHSHAPVEKAIELQAAYAELSVLAPSGARRRDAEIAVCPAQRSAMIYALLPEGRDALVPRIVEIALDIDGVDLALWRPAPREGAIANATRRAALRPRRRRARRARRALVDRRPAGGPRRARRGRRPAQPRLPRRPRRARGRRSRARRRATCCSPPRPATSSPTGAASTTWAAAATARCTASTRSARWPSAGSTRPTTTGRGRSPTSRRWCAGTSAPDGCGRRTPGAPDSGAGVAPPAAARAGSLR